MFCEHLDLDSVSGDRKERMFDREKNLILSDKERERYLAEGQNKGGWVGDKEEEEN